MSRLYERRYSTYSPNIKLLREFANLLHHDNHNGEAILVSCNTAVQIDCRSTLICSTSVSTTDDLLRTGATGYIGGDFLHAITQAHPELAIAALVRQSSSASKLKQEYPHVEVVQGNLDDHETLVKAGADADIVLSESILPYLTGKC